MPTTCITPIKAEVARIVKLDVCGNPVTGATSAVAVFDGFISIAPSPQYEEGQEFLTKKANGQPCVNQKDPNFLKRVALTVEFCNIDPDIIVMMTGERLLTTGGPVTGTGVAFGEGLLLSRFSLEVWQPLAGAICSPSGQQLYLYWAFPNIGNAMLGDFTIENGPTSITLTADTQACGLRWGDGPGTGVSWLNGNVLNTDEHFAFNVSAVPPPVAACGATTLT